MKKAILLLSSSTFLLFGPTYSQKSIQKDAKTGLELKADKLTFDSFDLTMDGKALSTNEIEFGAIAYITLRDVSGYTIKDEKCFPGCEIKVTDLNGKEVLYVKDAYERYSEGVSRQDGSILSSDLTVGDPMKAGETYLWKIRFWDKQNNGEIATMMKVKIKPNQSKITQQATGPVSYRNLYLVSENKVLRKNEFELGKKVSLYITGLKGFTVENNKVYAGWSMVLTDSKGTIILDYKDAFSNYASGIEVEKMSNVNIYINTGNPMKVGEMYTWTSTLWDKKGKNKISTKTVLKAK